MDDGTEKWVMIDVVTKQDIFPETFKEGENYKVYYEKETRIIVKVEMLSE